MQVPAGVPALPLAAVLAIGCAGRWRARAAPVPPQRARSAGRAGREPGDRVPRRQRPLRRRRPRPPLARRLHRARGRARPGRRPTGSGKSTLLRCINGLVPHFSGGRLSGSVVVAGRDTRTHRPRDLADLVGVVGAGPGRLVRHRHRRGGDRLRDGGDGRRGHRDAAAGRGDPRPARPGRGARPFAAGPLRWPAAAGGDRRRAGRGPRILVLDEPTSALDPVAAEDVLAALHRLVHDLGHHRRAGGAPPRARDPPRRPGAPGPRRAHLTVARAG